MPRNASTLPRRLSNHFRNPRMLIKVDISRRLLKNALGALRQAQDERRGTRNNRDNSVQADPSTSSGLKAQSRGPIVSESNDRSMLQIFFFKLSNGCPSQIRRNARRRFSKE